MPTVDEEFFDAAQKFIDKAVEADKPFFVWFNTTRMHVFTHLKKESVGKTGQGLHADGMVEHDGHVGQLLKQLDDLGIADNTIVLYTTDNGAEIALWPDGAMTLFRGEKGTTWEGGFRIPMMVRWPGVIKPGTVYNDIISLHRLVPDVPAPLPACPTSRRSWRRATTPATRSSRCTSTATTSCPTSRARRRRPARGDLLLRSGRQPERAPLYQDWKVSFAIQQGNIATATRDVTAGR